MLSPGCSPPLSRPRLFLGQTQTLRQLHHPVCLEQHKSKLLRNLQASTSSTPATMVQDDHTTLQLPATYKRLVARRIGSSFAEVAEVQQENLPQPAPNEVL